MRITRRKTRRNQGYTQKQPSKPERPTVCPKPDCGGLVFIAHEDGWQCFNCMKIIYAEQPLPLVTARPVKIGRYRTADHKA